MKYNIALSVDLEYSSATKSREKVTYFDEERARIYE